MRGIPGSTSTCRRGLLAAGCVVLMLVAGGCPDTGGEPNACNCDPTQSDSPPVFHNATDPTNDGATYIGSKACSACHADIYDITRLHGHTHALTKIDGAPPEYPAEASRAGVPNPPAGKAWSDIAYVISGYLHCGYFIDSDGFLMTTGIDGVNTKWLLDFPANGTAAGFVPFLSDQATPLPYDYDTCFKCHTTGPQPQDPADPRSQDSRRGILGTWAEPGVTCEACHGPGSKHAPNPQKRNIFVDSTPQTCGRCHVRGDDANTIVTTPDGFIDGNTQVAELRASGGHGQFTCMICHNPHASMNYDRDRALRNDCTDCHRDQNMAFHEGFVYRLGDYEETLSCKSCHMPLAAKNSTSAPASLVGPVARVGDVHSHIFRIDPDHVHFDDMFTPDGSAVLKDDQGRAGLSPAFVCIRCHNNAPGLFPLTPSGAANIARGMHERAANQAANP